MPSVGRILKNVFHLLFAATSMLIIVPLIFFFFLFIAKECGICILLRNYGLLNKCFSLGAGEGEGEECGSSSNNSIKTTHSGHTHVLVSF